MLHDVASMANQGRVSRRPSNTVSGRWQYTAGGVSGTRCCRRPTTPTSWCSGMPTMPKIPSAFRHFREVTFGLRLSRGQGLSGRVLAGGRLEWTTDLRRDLIDRAGLAAEELGIGSAVAFPVLLGEKVAAVLEFFSDRVIPPDSRIAEAMVGVGLQLGRVIERGEFQKHLLTIAEDIQRGIAQDLHDDIGQELTGLGLKVGTLAEMLAPGKTSAARRLAAEDCGRRRSHARQSSPAVAAECCRSNWRRGCWPCAGAPCRCDVRTTLALSCEFACSLADPVFDSRISMYLYRIAQEAVANALRHSGAHSIRIGLGRENGETFLRVEDDGSRSVRGIPPSGGHGSADHALSSGTDRREAGDRPAAERRDARSNAGGRSCPQKMSHVKNESER